MMVPLSNFASTRSGDKGNHANLGVVAHNARAFAHLQQHLTTERLQSFFANLGVTEVTRFELPRVLAFNFVLHNILAGGASRSLRLDTQGKLLGTLALELPLPPLE
jgi:hypothetical protein